MPYRTTKVLSPFVCWSVRGYAVQHPQRALRKFDGDVLRYCQYRTLTNCGFEPWSAPQPRQNWALLGIGRAARVTGSGNGSKRPGADIRAARYLPLGCLPRRPRHNASPIFLAVPVIDVSLPVFYRMASSVAGSKKCICPG